MLYLHSFEITYKEYMQDYFSFTLTIKINSLLNMKVGSIEQ